MAIVVLSPIFMTEPLPNCFSIWPSAMSSALSRSTIVFPLLCAARLNRALVALGGVGSNLRRGVTRPDQWERMTAT